MSERDTILAPGKLVIVGEYAVLDGAPAVALAIDRGVTCEVTPGGQGVQITTPDGDSRFVAPALEGAPAGHYHFSSWNPVDLPGKPGFGGSAAACVAACVAAGRPAKDALAIHHAVQGSGSGIDVLASIHGGMGRVEQRRWRPLPTLVPTVVYAGRSARTGPRVSAYQSWASPQRADFIKATAQLADHLSDEPIATFAEAWRLLTHMAASAGIAYRTPALDHIVRTAEELGGAAKPSGAGGGDCAVALLPDPEIDRRFRQACSAAGLHVIPVGAATGTRRQRQTR